MLDFATRFAQWASVRPEAPAAAFLGEHLTYGELLALTKTFAEETGIHSATFDHVVGVYLRNGVDFVSVFYAACILGHKVVVFDPAWSTAQLREAVVTVHVDVIVAASKDIGLFRNTSSPEPQAVSWPPHNAKAPSAPREWQDLDYHDDSPFLVGFTSGTTSSPKGFVRNRASWSHSLALSSDVFHAGRQDVTLAPGPLAHGLTLYALAESLYSGGLFVGVPSFTLDSVNEIAQRHQPTRLVCVPAALDRLVSQADPPSWFEGLRTVITSGAKMNADKLASMFAAAPLAMHYEYYGASELGFVSFRANHAAGTEQLLEDAETDVGLPFPSVAISVGKPGELAEESTGTLYVKSPLVSDGYLLPSDRGYRRSGEWVTVGDQGYIKNARLHVLGREGDMLVKNGNNIYPSEIDLALRTHPSVKESSVFLDRSGNELIAAVSVDETRPPVSRRELETHLGERVAKYKMPNHFMLVRVMPRTNSGKIARHSLAKQFLDGDPNLRPL